MKELSTIIASAIAALVIGVAAWFWMIPETVELPVRVPGMDNRPEGGAKREGGELTFKLETFETPAAAIKTENGNQSLPVDISDNWPHFRGRNRDANWNNKNYVVAQDWQAEPLESLWSIPVGEGYAGACIYNSIVYMLDYDTEKLRDVIRAIDLATGKDIWNLSYPIKIKRDHGMSRSIPAVTEKYVVTIGPRCQVVCADRKTGEKLWYIDLVAKYGSKVPLWHASQCPIIIDGKAIIAPSGTEALMIAVDCATGDIVWETANVDKWLMTHSSIMPLELDGVEMYIYCGDGGICGIEAATGKKLWVNYEWSMRTNVPTPIHIGDGRLFLCAGYNKGCALLKVYRTLGVDSQNTDTTNVQEVASSENSAKNADFTAEMVYMKPATVFGAVQHTPVIYDDFIYGIRQDKRLVCLDFDGNIQWESPINDKYGDSPFMIVNDQLIAFDDHGTLSLIALDPSEYKLISRQQILFGRESWGLMAISNGLLIVRDFTEMRCYRLAEKTK